MSFKHFLKSQNSGLNVHTQVPFLPLTHRAGYQKFNYLPSWEADKCLVTYECFNFDQISPLGCILSQMNPFNTLTSCYFKIRLNIDAQPVIGVKQKAMLLGSHSLLPQSA
jgi:hypothetical protein